MFDNVLVGVGNGEGGRDALALARGLVSAVGELTLVQVQVVTRKPSVDSGFVREWRERQRELSSLESFRDEVGVDARVTSVKALSVARGLHAFARIEGADLIVVGASRADEVERMLICDEVREVLHGAPCAVAVAPAGYASTGEAAGELVVITAADRPLDHFFGVSRSDALAEHPGSPLLVLPSAPHGARRKQPKLARASDRLAP